MTARVFGFYCERRGPLAAICFHHGPRKTMRWVQGLSSIVLSCSVRQRAGWSRQKSQEEVGPWTSCAALPKDPVGCKPSRCSVVPADGPLAHAMNLNI